MSDNHVLPDVLKKKHLIFTETIIDAPKAENGVDVRIWDRVSGLKKNLMIVTMLKNVFEGEASW